MNRLEELRDKLAGKGDAGAKKKEEPSDRSIPRKSSASANRRVSKESSLSGEDEKKDNEEHPGYIANDYLKIVITSPPEVTQPDRTIFEKDFSYLNNQGDFYVTQSGRKISYNSKRGSTIGANIG